MFMGEVGPGMPFLVDEQDGKIVFRLPQVIKKEKAKEKAVV